MIVAQDVLAIGEAGLWAVSQKPLQRRVSHDVSYLVCLRHVSSKFPQPWFQPVLPGFKPLLFSAARASVYPSVKRG